MGRYLIFSFFALSVLSALGAASISHTNVVPNLIVLTNSFVKEETVQDGLTLGGVRLTAWPAGTGDLIAANGMTNLAPLLGAGGVAVQATNAAGFRVNVGLGNVDNTSDANKPVSSATQTALDGKVSKAGDTMSGTLEILSTAADASTNRILKLNTTQTWATGAPQTYIFDVPFTMQSGTGGTNYFQLDAFGGMTIGARATNWAAFGNVAAGSDGITLLSVHDVAAGEGDGNGIAIYALNSGLPGVPYCGFQSQGNINFFTASLEWANASGLQNQVHWTAGDNTLGFRMDYLGAATAQFQPLWGNSSVPAFWLSSAVNVTSGNIFAVQNNGTNKFAVAWDGSIYSPKLTASRLTVATSSNTLSSVSTTGLVDGTGTAADASDVTGALAYTPLNKAGDTLTGNLLTELGAGVTNYVDFNYASRTNLLTANIAFAHATNAVTGKHHSHVRWMLNASGGNLTFAIPAAWKTNVYSAVPPALTNGTITKMIVEAWGDTATAANQTNCFVAFEYYK